LKLVVALTFSLVLYFVITGKLNKTIAAMVGGLTLLAIGVFPDPYEGLKETIDINTLLFLIGMMIFVRVMETSGIFEYIAIKTVKIAGTSLTKLFFAITFVVGFVSAFIDNVTTILIFAPITFAISDVLNIDPVPFVLGEIFASNIGGTMTPIGDPPNILITSAAKIPFTEFTKYMVPVNLIILFLADVSLLVIFRKEFSRRFSREFLEAFDESKIVKSRKRFVLASGFMFFIIFLFLLQKPLKLESSIIGLIAGFFGLLIFKPQEITPFLEKVEWEVIFFFLGLFIITGAMEKVGIMKDIANFLVKIASGSAVTLVSVTVWASGIVSGFVDNIPFAATMIPVIKDLPTISPQFSNITPLWYALSLGVCLGGNLTPVGASANVVGLTLLKKYKGKEIAFHSFVKYSFAVVFISLVVSNVFSLILLKIL